MAVMMQAFYLDSPKRDNREHDWWNFVAKKIEDLGKPGFNALWLLPVSKAASATSMGYDPYDYFDLGADMVINRNAGADDEETNLLDGKKRWTNFAPKSRRFPRDSNCFHSSRYERMMVDGENYEGFPHLCHRNPLVYAAMYEYTRMLIEELGFDGFHFDFAKGFGAWMIGLLAKHYYVKDGKEFTPYIVSEYWSGGEYIPAWLDRVNEIADTQIAAFDFPLRYKLKDVCDTLHYDLRNLTDGGNVTMRRPTYAATFVDNHAMGDNLIINDKLLAYSFIMMHEDYPCVFWYDYYNNGLARPFIRHATPDLHIMQRIGWKDHSADRPGLMYPYSRYVQTLIYRGIEDAISCHSFRGD